MSALSCVPFLFQRLTTLDTPYSFLSAPVMMNSLSPLLLVCALFCPEIAAHNGMDMDMDMPMQLASGNVLMYLHFTPGDILWFEGWVPKSTGAMIGACIGLFLLAMVERWVSAMRGVMEGYWRAK